MKNLEFWKTVNEAFYKNKLVSKKHYQLYKEILKREEERKEKKNEKI